MRSIRAVYKNMCPNCGGDVESDRLALGLPCGRCLPSLDDADQSRGSVVEKLEKAGKLSGLYWVSYLEREFEDFSRYFRSKLGMELWSAQRSWAKRLLAGESFAIVAPTGVGKTTLLQAYVSYACWKKGWRALYLAPTENLVRQVYTRISGLADGVVAYYSSMGSRAREEALARIASGSFKILVATPAFLRKRFSVLANLAPLDLVIVDDVDSLLRDSGDIERLLELLGVPREGVMIAYKLVKTKIRLFKQLASGANGTESLEAEIAELESNLRRVLASAKIGQVVVASATGRPGGLRYLLFREILGFEAGGSADYLRNVADLRVSRRDVEEAVAEVVSALGKGGIVFVSQALGSKHIDSIVEKLEKRGLRVCKAKAGSWSGIIKLERGEADVLVTVASRYGVAVRGLDAPLRVRYTVFARAPARKLEASRALQSPSRLLRLLIHMAESGDEEAQSLARKLRAYLDKLDDPSLLRIALKKGASSGGGDFLSALARVYAEAVERALAWLSSSTAGGRVLRVGSAVYVSEDGRLYAYLPDALTYIQASGRSSRMLGGRMTFGLSVVVEPEDELVEALEERASWVARIEFKPLESVDLKSLLERVEESRRAGGEGGGEGRVSVDSVLLVVESPTKAKTIAWFWGRPARRRLGDITVYETSASDPASGRVYLLTVVATRGHVFDLVESDGDPASRYGVRVGENTLAPVYSTIRRCRVCGASFVEPRSCPRCGSSSLRDSRSVVEALRKLALGVDYVVVATDPDREGEKIAWDVSLTVAPYNRRVYRARFYEVTREALMRALASLDAVDERLVYSQIARRVVDRWVGFRASDYLKTLLGREWLGAGRVQTPLLGWIVSRYAEWRESRGYRVCLDLEVGHRLCLHVRERSDAEAIASLKTVEVVDASRETASLHPPPPYTTDSLLSDASRMLKLSAEDAMRLAQDLFESGLITYHRTDSTRVSAHGMAVAGEYLEKRGLGGLFKPRAWGSGGAHEAIRPTRPLDVGELEKAILDGSIRVPVRLTRLHLALYDMIFRRFVASQMTEASVVRARVAFRLGDFVREVEGVARIVSEGFTAVSPVRVDSWMERVSEASRIAVASSSIARGSAVGLLTSGEAVKLMKERGVGRPSTYHKAIEANKRHGYVVESKRVKALVPTKLGIEVYKVISEAFPEMASEEYTRSLEEKLDLIEAGSLDPAIVLEDVWRELSETLKPPSVVSETCVLAAR